MTPPFRAEQVGSLLRPAALLEARKSLNIFSDALSPELASATKLAISDVVQEQLRLSIRPITSGEFERTIFFSGFFEKLQGMTKRTLPVPDAFRTGFPTSKAMIAMGYPVRDTVVCTGAIRHVESAYLEAWEMLKAAVPPEQWKDCKVAIPSLTFEHIELAHGTAYEPGVYASDKEYFADLAAAYRAELKILYDAGLRRVQIDDPNLTFFVVEEFRAGFRKDGLDPEDTLDLYIWAHNELLRDQPDDMHIGIHLCRGNTPAYDSLDSDSYEAIAQKLLTKLNYNTVYLEFHNERAGPFDPLRFLPRGKHVVLGLVSTKTSEMEEIAHLESRVREAAEVIAKGQGRPVADVLEDSLAVSPQCGFASMSMLRGQGITEEIMWKKLVLLRDTARRLWADAI
ncbi:UROD/MetE-like protein [Thozetella sp. PMI_491]|nr:UROD/MetE-like protein [Thozetella sp. PMI_491]